MRTTVAAAAAVVVVLSAAWALARSGAEGDARPAGVVVSTRVATWRDEGGDGTLERGGGEALVARTELAPRSAGGELLASFAQITDAHVVDEESPARVEMLDRVGPPFTSAFRPQEALTAQVLAATVAALNRLPLDDVVVTGDLVDNAQRNELDTALAVLRGGEVDPGSGARGYDGVQAAENPDPFLYRPDVDPPRHRGLLAAAQRPFASPGVRARLWTVVGNHDVLLQGNQPPSARLAAVAVGDRKVLELDERALTVVRERRFSRTRVEELLAGGLPGPAVNVPADRTRVPVAATEVVRRLRPRGARATSPYLDYAFPLGRGARGLVLDTARRDGGADGVLRPGQLRWLRSELARADERPIVVFSHTPLTATAGGDAALRLFDRDPRIVALVSGHTHRNAIVARRTPAGGYWLVSTASLVDYPQQARAFRLERTARGGVVLKTWMVDHTGARLAATSRELAYLDYQGGRAQGAAGSRLDRNVALYR